MKDSPGEVAAASPERIAPGSANGQPAPPVEPAPIKETRNGLYAVIAGCAAVTVIAVFAFFIGTEKTNLATLASAAFGVIGSVVGAYLGVKVTSDSTKRALEGARVANDSAASALQEVHAAVRGQAQAAARADVYAAHVDPSDAAKATDQAQAAAREAALGLRPPDHR